MADIDSNFPAACVPVPPSASGVGVYDATLLPPCWPPNACCPNPGDPNAGVVVWVPNGEL